MKAFWLRYRGTQFPVRRGEYLLGRSPYCSIVIANPLASRRHCALRLTPDGLVLVDLGSANGTHVNGERVIGERPLLSGDRVRIGSEVMIIEQATEAAPNTTQRTRHDTVQGLGRTTPLPAAEPDPGADADGFEDESSTITHANTLELLEALVTSAADSERPHDLAPIIQRTVERVVSQGSPSLSREERRRLCGVIAGVTSWFPTGTLDEWQQGVLETLGADLP